MLKMEKCFYVCFSHNCKLMEYRQTIKYSYKCEDDVLLLTYICTGISEYIGGLFSRNTVTLIQPTSRAGDKNLDVKHAFTAEECRCQIEKQAFFQEALIVFFATCRNTRIFLDEKRLKNYPLRL